MSLPRDVTGQKLIKLLKQLEYEPTRQVGSHIRLTTTKNGTHHITIPNHKPLKIGTFSSILNDIGQHFGKSKDEIWQILNK